MLVAKTKQPAGVARTTKTRARWGGCVAAACKGDFLGLALCLKLAYVLTNILQLGPESQVVV